MLCRKLIGATALFAALLVAPAAQAFDESKYPDLKGEWLRVARSTGAARIIQYDPSKLAGLAQEAPLKPEYQAILEANMKDHAEGGQAGDPTALCLAPGMPRVMGAYAPMEIVVTPQTTYILIEHIHDSRRIYTDGRDFPTGMELDPQFSGYSIGKWTDEDSDGRYHTLVAETRGLKGPRTYEATGIPFHEDNQTIIHERIYLDRADANTLHDEITVIDNALTRPWTVIKSYRRNPTAEPLWWREDVCAENNVHVAIGNEVYFLSADGQLMPAKKDQRPPDLRYFKKTQK
jgi:hypothetical protein